MVIARHAIATKLVENNCDDLRKLMANEHFDPIYDLKRTRLKFVKLLHEDATGKKTTLRQRRAADIAEENNVFL